MKKAERIFSLLLLLFSSVFFSCNFRFCRQIRLTSSSSQEEKEEEFMENEKRSEEKRKKTSFLAKLRKLISVWKKNSLSVFNTHTEHAVYTPGLAASSSRLELAKERERDKSYGRMKRK